ncbi:hypothetical protein POTOM_009339 [Populus tomentosa]|uniref:Uncharacterized protein n=1 Tax=Populus tomentosa TaxID=118781 RepID=A0A8X8A879_POPTO|nr:hypothetical protein POTOM_009339 [Populus tomentosa]
MLQRWCSWPYGPICPLPGLWRHSGFSTNQSALEFLILKNTLRIKIFCQWEIIEGIIWNSEPLVIVGKERNVELKFFGFRFPGKLNLQVKAEGNKFLRRSFMGLNRPKTSDPEKGMPEKGWKWHILWAIYNSSLTAEGSVSSSSLVGSASVLEVASFV